MSIALAVAGLLICTLMIVVSVVARRRSRDEIFEGLTPGLLPLKGQQPGRRRLSGREYAGPVAVQFSPPRDVAPGLVGTIVDGRAEMRDVTATIVDLAVRGFLTIKTVPLLGENEAPEVSHDAPVGETGPSSRRKKAKQDWLLRADPNPPSDVRPFEKTLLQAMFGQGPTVRMSDLQHGFGAAMREAQVDLYRQVVDNGWYPRHPLAKGGKLRIWGGILLALGVLAAVVVFGAIGADRLEVPAFLLPLGMVIGGIVALVIGRGVRVGRTAEGTAMMIQSLGFKQYLATAEADQIKFEEASEIFSRYLPYAIVFGVAEHWSKVFGDVAKRYKEMGGGGLADGGYTGTDLMFDLMWFDFMTPDLHFGGDADLFAVGDAFGGGFDMPDMGEMFGNVGEGAGEVFGAFTEGVSGFVDSAGGFEMPDLGGCDLDGCDLG
ncbi:DUF2207 domain-containing protein [Mariniluteicoccus flavus]